MKITEYVTARADDFAALDGQVNQLLKEGYQPYGNPYLTDNPVEGKIDTFLVAQAMVRCERVAS